MSGGTQRRACLVARAKKWKILIVYSLEWGWNPQHQSRYSHILLLSRLAPRRPQLCDICHIISIYHLLWEKSGVKFFCFLECQVGTLIKVISLGMGLKYFTICAVSVKGALPLPTCTFKIYNNSWILYFCDMKDFVLS